MIGFVSWRICLSTRTFTLSNYTWGTCSAPLPNANLPRNFNADRDSGRARRNKKSVTTRASDDMNKRVSRNARHVGRVVLIRRTNSSFHQFHSPHHRKATTLDQPLPPPRHYHHHQQQRPTRWFPFPKLFGTVQKTTTTFPRYYRPKANFPPWVPVLLLRRRRREEVLRHRGDASPKVCPVPVAIRPIHQVEWA